MSSPTQLSKLLAQRVLARRRLLQFTQTTHPSYSAGWVHEDICRRLEKFSRDVENKLSPRLMLLVPPRHGKLLADDTMVYTKKGWKTHGTLEVGDEVLGLKAWTKVIGVSAPGVATHWVVMNSGAKVLTHLDHEWAISEYQGGISKGGKVEKYKTGTVNGYLETIRETRDFLNWKEKRGNLRAYQYTMRKFYLPQPYILHLAKEEFEIFKHRRRVCNGGMLAVEDVYEAETPQTGRCIQVEALDGIYLVTRDAVPTHNSELASIRFPAWHIGHNPTHEIINVGYNLDLPMKFSRKVREIMREGHYQSIFPDARLDPDAQSVEAWNTTRGGGFTAAGVGGGITGKGCHILTVDDPIKNQEEADSIITRDKLWDWYQSTAYTRLAPGGGVLVIETFWNDDDLAGRLQQAMRGENGADQFEIVRYPALSEAWEYRDETDSSIHRFEEEQAGTELTLLRPKDTCLHADRYPTDALVRIRANLQPRIWSALYQQNPVPDEGMYFKKDFFRYHKALPSLHGNRVYTAWDFAIGEKQQNDWTVGATVMQDHTDTLYVLEVFRMKGDSMQIIEAILDVAQRWGSEATSGYLIGAEDGQIWRSILPLLKKRMTERKQYPPYEVLRPLTDKLARARPLQGRMQQGRVVFPEGASWVAQAEQELLRFPAGAHDDVVDALAWATHLCIGKEPPRVAQPPPLKSWRDSFGVVEDCGHMAA